MDVRTYYQTLCTVCLVLRWIAVAVGGAMGWWFGSFPAVPVVPFLAVILLSGLAVAGLRAAENEYAGQLNELRLA